jgi:hypothetical protein
MSESFHALRRANPRAAAAFTQAIEAAAGAVRTRIIESAGDPPAATGTRLARAPRRLLGGVPIAGVALAAAAAAAVFLTVGSPDGPGVENSAAAVQRAATATAASAEQSGTAVVRMTHNGEPWAGKTIRWNGGDLAVASDAPEKPRQLLVVDGILYGYEPADGGWLELGDPASIDPDSGTTPDEYLAAVHEDIAGVALRRIVDGMTGLTTERREDGSTVYRGSVAAGLVARESAFKGEQPIRVFPFGYVAHDEAADPSALLAAAVTVEANGLVREVAVSWGTPDSAWTYTVGYTELGTTAPLTAPENARPLRDGLRSA